MHELTLNCKKLDSRAVLPSKKNTHDAGFDLFANETVIVRAGETQKIKTGIALEIPSGYVGLIWPRSSMGVKGLIILGGVIDSTYRGEVMILVGNFSYREEMDNGDMICSDYIIEKGDKIAQILIQESNPFIMINEVDKLSSSSRGESGFGSSGK